MSAAVSRELLEARLAREREELADALDDLRAQTRAELDPRCRVRERPAAWLAGAALIGFLWGAGR